MGSLPCLSFYLFSIVCFLTYPLGRFCPAAHLVLPPVLSCRPSCPVARLVLSPVLSCRLPCRSTIPLALWLYYFSCLLLTSCLLCLLFSFIIPPLLRPMPCDSKRHDLARDSYTRPRSRDLDLSLAPPTSIRVLIRLVVLLPSASVSCT